MKTLVVLYSMYGHIHAMAEAAVESAAEIPGMDVALRRVPETLNNEILGKMGALEAQKKLSDILVCTPDDLASADAMIFGTPTRFGNMFGN